MKSKQEIQKIIQTAMDHDDRLALATFFGLDADSWDLVDGQDNDWQEADLRQELSNMVDNSKYLALANKFFGYDESLAQQILNLLPEEQSFSKTITHNGEQYKVSINPLSGAYAAIVVDSDEDEIMNKTFKTYDEADEAIQLFLDGYRSN